MFLEHAKIMNITVGNKLKEIRKSQKWSQEDVANYLQISQSLYAQIERGESMYWIDNLETICRVFTILPEQLIRNSVEINIFEKCMNMEKLKTYEKTIQEQEIRIAELKEVIKKLKKSA